jgi:tetratricopeptide (TPR) repeat protein
MGSTYYREHRYPEARAQFEALQAIDPDDVAAHYNLAILYRRLGLPEKAAEQAAQFATKKTDPGAPTYSSDFLRRHPEISEESIPWHVHTDLKPETTSANAPVASASATGAAGPGAP